MILFENVDKCFGNGQAAVKALRGLDLRVPQGQMCALMGPSGSGKSTALHLAAGLIKPDRGRVVVGSFDVGALDDVALTRMRRREVGIVFQFFNLLPYLDAYENVALPLRLDRVPKDEEEERVRNALELVNLNDRLRHKPSELSGGETQRVAIARALVISPSVLLADEPTGNLDTAGGRNVLDILRDINESSGLTILVVTHDPIWGSYCDRIVRIQDGSVSEDVELPPDRQPSPAIQPEPAI